MNDILTPSRQKELELLVENSVRKALGESRYLSREGRLNDSNNHWFDVDGLRNYLSDKPAAITIYKWVAAKSIPFHKGSRRLRFLKSEIDQWLLQNGNTPNQSAA